MMNMKSLTIEEILNWQNEIRNKKIKDMTIDDALMCILAMLSEEGNTYPCGYSHTNEAFYKIVKEIKKS